MKEQSAKTNATKEVSEAQKKYFEHALKIISFKTITDLLLKEQLITKKEEKLIRKKIEEIDEAFKRPILASAHSREVNEIPALPDDHVYYLMREEYQKKYKNQNKK